MILRSIFFPFTRYSQNYNKLSFRDPRLSGLDDFQPNLEGHEQASLLACLLQPRRKIVHCSTSLWNEQHKSRADAFLLFCFFRTFSSLSPVVQNSELFFCRRRVVVVFTSESVLRSFKSSNQVNHVETERAPYHIRGPGSRPGRRSDRYSSVSRWYNAYS